MNGLSAATVEFTINPRGSESPEQFVESCCEVITDAAARFGRVQDALFLLTPTQRAMGLIATFGQMDTPKYINLARALSGKMGAECVILVMGGTVGISPDGEAPPESNTFEGGLLVIQQNAKAEVHIRGLRVGRGPKGYCVIEKDTDSKQLDPKTFGIIGR